MDRIEDRAGRSAGAVAKDVSVHDSTSSESRARDDAAPAHLAQTSGSAQDGLVRRYEEQRTRTGPGWKGVGATAIGLGILFAKFKSLFFILLNFKWIVLAPKLLISSLGFIASVWLYALFWGWKFAFVLMLLILIHEMGHVLVMRFYGIPSTLPFFVPGFGAFVSSRGGPPASVAASAYIALGGPLVGGLAAFGCLALGEVALDPFWVAMAYTGFFLNLFNLFPAPMLDGGKVLGAISPRIWMVGLAMLIVSAFAFHWFNPLIVILIIVSIPQAIAAWRGDMDAQFAAVTGPERIGIAIAYFGLCGALLALMVTSHVAVPGRHFG